MDNNQLFFAVVGLSLTLKYIFYTTVYLIRFAIWILSHYNILIELFLVGLCFWFAFPELRCTIYDIIDNIIYIINLIDTTICCVCSTYTSVNSTYMSVNRVIASYSRFFKSSRRPESAVPPPSTPLPPREEIEPDYDTIVILPGPDNLDGPHYLIPSTEMLIECVRPEDIYPVKDDDFEEISLPVVSPSQKEPPSHLKAALIEYAKRYNTSYEKEINRFRTFYPQYVW